MSKKSRERRERLLLRNIAGKMRFYDVIREIIIPGGGYEIPVIDISELEDFTKIKSKTKVLLGDELRNMGVPVKPPFDRVFLEMTKDSSRCGIYINQINLVESGVQSSEEAADDETHCLVLSTWFQMGHEITNFHCQNQIYLGGNGMYKSFDIMNSTRKDHATSKDDPTAILLLTIATNLALKTFALLNCRNIELVDHEPDPVASREYERHFGQPLTKYKTLAIKSMSKRYESGDPQPYQDLMPLHLRRGNFATYTDEAPLFGKYTGTFWRPATVVGNEKNGIVVKDYKIEAPEDKSA